MTVVKNERLTVESGEPVLQAPGEATYTPVRGGAVPVYDGATWVYATMPWRPAVRLDPEDKR